MARVHQITEKSELPAGVHPLYDRIAQARGRVAGPYSILLHAPAVADKVDLLAASLRDETALSREEYLLTVLAVARAKDCLFVWSVQARNARRTGLPDAIILAIRDRRTEPLNADQVDIVSFAQQMAAGNRVDGETFARLQERHGVRWLVELATVAGHFILISGINNAFEVPPSEDGDLLPV